VLLESFSGRVLHRCVWLPVVYFTFEVNVKWIMKLDYKRKISDGKHRHTSSRELDWVPIKDLPQQYRVSKTSFL